MRPFVPRTRWPREGACPRATPRRGWPVTLAGEEVVGPQVLARFDQALATLGHGVPRDLNSSCLSPRKDSLRQVNGNASKRGCHADGYRRASEGCECEPGADSSGAAHDGRPPLNYLVSVTRDVGLILAPASHQPSFSDQDAYAQARSEAEGWLLELTLEWVRARTPMAQMCWSECGRLCHGRMHARCGRYVAASLVIAVGRRTKSPWASMAIRITCEYRLSGPAG